MKLLPLLAIAATALALTGCDPQPKADEPTANTSASSSTKLPTEASDTKTETAAPATR